MSATPPDVDRPDPPRLRDEHAAVTKARILGSARRLFSESGYGRTSIRHLAADAGVSVQTVYAAFGSKRGLLEAMIPLVAEEAEVAQTQLSVQMMTRGQDICSTTARLYRRLHQRCGDILLMFDHGAAIEDETAAVARIGEEANRAGITRMVEHLDELGELRPDLGVGAATATALALLSRHVHRELVSEMGWDEDRYETWLAEALIRSLLAD